MVNTRMERQTVDSGRVQFRRRDKSRLEVYCRVIRDYLLICIDDLTAGQGLVSLFMDFGSMILISYKWGLLIRQSKDT